MDNAEKVWRQFYDEGVPFRIDYPEIPLGQMLDEPSLGIAPLLLERIFAEIKDINRRGMTMLLVEQNAGVALSIAHHGYILETGEIVLAGEAQQLLNEDRVKQAYLGV